MDNLHFNLNYPDFTQQTPLHVIHQHQHQHDPSFQDLPTSYSTFSLLPTAVPTQLSPSTVNVNKEQETDCKHLLQATSMQPHQHQEPSSQQQKQLTPTTTVPASLNLFSPSSSPGYATSQKPTSSRTRVTRPPNAFLLFNKEMRKRLKIDNPSWTVSDISKEIGDRWRTLSQEQKHQYVIHANKIKESQQALHPNAMYIRRSKAELTEAGHYEKVEKKRADGQILSQVMVATASPSSTTAASSPSLTRTISSTSSTSSTLINCTVAPPMMDPNGFFVSTGNNNNGQTYVMAGPRTTKRTRRKQKRDKNPGAPKHPLSAYMWFLTEVRSETRQSYPGSTVGQISKLCADRWHAMTEADRLPYLTMASTDKARYAREMRVYASQNNHTMGRGTRQKYRASSPSSLLATEHHALFYASTSTSPGFTTDTSSSSPLVSTPTSFSPSTSILRNSLPGNVAMQDTLSPSELLHSTASSPSSLASSNLHHHHTESY